MNKLFTKAIGAALGLTMAIGVGVAVAGQQKGFREARAEDLTAEKTTNQLVTQYSWTISAGSSVVVYDSWNLDNNITISTSGSPNCGSIWGSSTHDWRLYQNKSGDVTATAKAGYSIKSVEYTYNSSNSGTLKDGTTTIISGEEVAVNDTTKTLTVGNTGSATNGQVKITKFKVIYEAVETTDPSITITNESISGKVGDTVALTYEDANTEAFTSKTVEWSVPENSIATISGSTLTFVKNGDNVAVTATLKDNGVTKATDTKNTSLLAPSVAITGDGVANHAVKIAPSASIVFGETHENQPTANYSYVWSHTGSAGTFNAETKTYTANAVGEDTVTVTMKYNTTEIATDSVTVKVVNMFDNTNGEYHKVTSLSQLYDGANVAIVDADSGYAMLNGFTTTKNVSATAVTFDNVTSTISKTDVLNVELVKTATDTYRFKIDDDEYLYASSSGSNYLQTGSLEATGDNGKFLIELEGTAFTVTAQGTNTRNVMRFNPNNGNPIFSCYASNSSIQTSVAFYVFETYEEEATAFADHFLEETAGYCSAKLSDGVKTELKARYDALTDVTDKGAKQLFEGATIVRGKGKTYDNSISEALSRYVNMVEEERETNFLGLDDSVLNKTASSFGTSEDNTIMIILVVISAVSLLAVTSLLVIRRKKER